LALSRGL
jgi:site-specific DNA recombinase